MIALLAPLMIAALATLFIAGLARRLVPAHAAWLSATAIGAVFVTALVTSWTVALGYLAHEPHMGEAFAWCRGALGAHHGVSRWIGIPAVGTAAWTAVRALRVHRSWRRAHGDHAGQIHVVKAVAPLAYAQTGPSGGVIISTGMLEALDPGERTALIAHERAHLRHRHDRFLVIGTLGSGLPPLMPAVRELRHALERWADEDAADATGDRSLVAHAVAHAALAAHGTPAPALSMLGACVPGRVEALLAPPVGSGATWRWTTLAISAALVAIGAASVQLHHLAAVLSVLCPG